jgi:glutathione synthase
MTMKLGVVMDPIDRIHYKKDSTLAMLWEASHREWPIYYFEQKDLFLKNGVAYGVSRALKVYKDANRWYEFGEEKTIALSQLDVMLMRKDPPFDLEYIYTTYILEQAERDGVMIVNKPQSLRDANEKLFTTWFTECCPPTLVTRSMALLREFFSEHNDIVCKPLDAMGGASVFRLRENDPNASVVFETLTHRETHHMMAQKFIPEIVSGDKRILMINGEPLPFALARVPSKGDWRGNLVAGAEGVARPLTERDRKICEVVGPHLREKGLLFVGLDVIGDYLTEINVTSPTCIRELDQQCHLNISAILFDCIEQRYDTYR